jgi:general stress protein 26
MKPTSTPASDVHEPDHVKKLGQLIRKVKVAMLTTNTPERAMHSCPMMTQDLEFDGDLWFFTSKTSGKVTNIKADPVVNVVYSNPDDQIYVSVSGRAELVEDREKIEEFWKPAYKLWFEGGKDDPNLALIRVQVENAEYWDSPASPVVYLAGFAKALITGKKPAKIGDHEKVEIH